MPKIVDRVVVRERIDPGITASLFSNYRSSADAVLELIDNSVDSRIAGRPLAVDVAVHPASIQVTTIGGMGMGPRDLERSYLRWGGSQKRGRNLLGQYGQGGKAAIGHLGGSFTIEASRPDDAVSWRFHDTAYRDRTRLKTYELEQVTKRIDSELGFLRVRIDAVDRRVDVRRLGLRLSETYRLLLEGGGLTIVLNRTPLAPPAIHAEERQGFRVRAAGTTISGWFGTVDPDRRGSDFVPGLRAYRLGRLISRGEFFGHPDAIQAPGMARLIGEVEVPLVSLTMNKGDFDRDSAAWVAIEDRMHRVLAPLARRLMRENVAPPPVRSVRAAEQARKLLAQALRLSEREDLFAGQAAGTASAQGGAAGEREGELPLKPPETAATPNAKNRPPSVPPPAADGEARARQRGFGAIQVRRLDPSIRSQLVVEDTGTLVIINSEHPLFVERKGDMWYQLETAAREICKGIEGVTLAEYERRVNEIVLLAFQLQGRRRRRRDTGRQLRMANQ
jgi:hypothetical protein